MRVQRVGPYRVLARLGQGGGGQVWLARDERLGRPVALKLLDRHGDVLSALKEARMAAALTHPNIIALYDVLPYQDSQVLVMEYLAGGNLSELCAARRAPLNDIVQLLFDVASGLDAASQIGLVHRDITPANVLRDTDGRAKLADFGIALLHDASRDPLRPQPGTLAALTPEHLRGQAPSGASDLFCLGLLAFRLLTGTHPFFTRGQLDTERLQSGQGLSLEALRPDLPASLRQLVAALLAVNPAQRPRSALMVRETLLECWATLPVSLR